jgi:hypothetical protein
MIRKAPRLALAFALLAAVAFAHDVKLHKGKGTEGEIVSMTADGFQMKTAKGNQKVRFRPETKIEHGTQQVGKDHLKAGDRVTVFGTKLASGELVAKEIVMGGGADRQKASPDHKH